MAFPNPFTDRPFRLSVGIRPLDPARWLIVDDQHDTQLTRKAALLAGRHDEVVATTAGSEAAGAEVLAMVGDARGCVVDVPDGMHPLDAAGRLVQEDLCVLEDRGNAPVLTAATVCFPNRWLLADKMGLSLGRIHAPVPGYAERIEAATDRVIARLAPDAPVWRLNWSLVDDAELFQPTPLGRGGGVAPADVADRIHLRIERQTLRRLAGTGAVVFTIHTTVRALADLVDRPDVLGSMAVTLRTLPPETLAYKELTGSRDAILTWIESIVGAGGWEPARP